MIEASGGRSSHGAGRRETSHPVEVSAGWTTGMQGCGKEDQCGLWGTALLRISDDAEPGHHSAIAFLTAAGCRQCGEFGATQSDIGSVVMHTDTVAPEQDRSQVVLNQTVAAERSLAEALQGSLSERLTS